MEGATESGTALLRVAAPVDLHLRQGPRASNAVHEGLVHLSAGGSPPGPRCARRIPPSGSSAPWSPPRPGPELHHLGGVSVRKARAARTLPMAR